MLDLAYAYAEDVRAKKIPVCKYVRQAVDRWYRDLDTGGARGLYFDENAAARVFVFYSGLRHSKGKWKGKPVILEPWQAFIIANVFGWKRADGRRRFQTAYEEIPRKNGKTTKIGGVGLYGLVADNEGGAEIYSAATKRDQAKIMFSEACNMVKQSPLLRRALKVGGNEISFAREFAKFSPLGQDSDTSDGLNVHFGLVDEVHAHKTSEMWDVLESALGAREQALMWAITTAGTNKEGVCYDLRDYAIKVLSGSQEDDSFFAIIYTIDKKDLDNWADPKVWQKANPNFGISVDPDYLAAKARKAAIIPSAKNNFLTKHLNVWVNVDSPWIDPEVFAKLRCEFSEAVMQGTPCAGGLDLASVSDMCSWTLAFEWEGKTRLIQRAYLPEDVIQDHTDKYNQPFREWEKQGWLVITPGNATDYAFIEHDLKQVKERFNLTDMAVDRWNSSQTVNNLTNEGFELVGFGQGFASMSGPMKELERMVLAGTLEYNNPIMSWAVSNTVAQLDPSENIKPAKNRSKGKIDMVVSAIMAIARLQAANDDEYLDADSIVIV